MKNWDRRFVRGPAELDCPGKCEVPAGAVVEEVHPLGTNVTGRPVQQCPNIGCGKLLVYGEVPGVTP